MEKKKRSLAEEFDWYYRKLKGDWSIRHRLSKVDAHMGSVDKYCKELDVEGLKEYVRIVKNNLKPHYPTYEEYIYSRTLIKIVRDWYKYKIAYGDTTEFTPIDKMPPDFDTDSGIVTSRRDDNTPIFLSVDLSEDESYYIVRDKEGLEIYRHSSASVPDNPQDYTYYQPTGLKAYQSWEYYPSMQHLISGQYSKSGTCEYLY